MLKNACCYICLIAVKRTINIYKTDLQYVYEKLADIKIRGNECWMCYICHTRLRQCHRLQQLAVQTQGLIDDLCEKKINTFGTFGTLLELSIHNEKMISVPLPSSYMKQETELSNDDVIEGESIKNKNDCKEQLLIEFEVPQKVNDAGCNRDLPMNVDRNDTWKDSKEHLLNLVKLKESVDDKIYVRQRPTTHRVTEEYHEDRSEQTAALCADEQSIGNVEIKQEKDVEIEDKGIEQDVEQENITDCEGRDNASEAQSSCCKKRLICDFCLKMFSCKSKLLQHIRCHTGEKPYSCETCLKKFSQKSALNLHKHIHVDKKPFSCDICSKEFYRPGDLKKHIHRNHDAKPFRCNICGKKFSHNCDLNRHQEVHSSDRPFSCNICQYRFAHRRNLNDHILTHSENKPFSCPICQKKFARKRDLNRHNNSCRCNKS